MVASSSSTIAQLLCYETPPFNFAKLIGELDQAIEMELDRTFKIGWDCDAVATFDKDGTRILLAWNDLPGQKFSGVLTLSVGPSPLPGKPMMRPDYDLLCARLATMLQERCHASDVVWHHMACHMSSEWVDILAETLTEIEDEAAAPEAAATEAPAAAARHFFPDVDVITLQYPPAFVANGPQTRKPVQDADLIRIRSALYEEEETQQYSTPMRLAVHAMNATLIMVWMPLGAAAMVHGLVRGEDMRLASRLMVLTGTFAALAQSSIGQQVVSLAGI